MKKLILYLLVILGLGTEAKAQISAEPKELRHEYVSPQQIVTIVATTPFNQALTILDSYSRKFLNKIIIDPDNRTTPIGVDVDRMQWLDALEAILRQNGLWYKEYETYIQIIPGQQQVTVKGEEKQGPGVPALPPGTPTLDSREVNIRAIFFEADISKLDSRGINLNLILQNTLNGITPLTTQNITVPNATISSGATITQGQPPSVAGQLNLSGQYTINNFGTITALFGFLESEDLGSVLASPEVTVRSGMPGNIQVGQNFFVTTKDFAGNTVQQMYNAGIIISVTPTVYTQDSIDFVSLDLDLTNSSLGGSQQTGQVVNTEHATTKVLLLNGEQTAIGGLYSTTLTTHREGIPILKDLPWWVFGIRYLTGSDQVVDQKKELIILLKASVVPTLKERFEARATATGPQENKTFQQELQQFEQSIKKYDQSAGK